MACWGFKRNGVNSSLQVRYLGVTVVGLITRRNERYGLGPRLRLPRYSGLPLVIHCDPAGKGKMRTDEQTHIQILEKHGYRVFPAITNSFAARRESVAQRLMLMIDGAPGLLISPVCKVLRKGFQGGYRFRRVQVVGEPRWENEADKNRFSYPHDALQYA